MAAGLAMDIFGIDQRIVLTAFYSGLGVGSVYALVAIGYNLVYRATRVFNLAQGDIVSWGGLIAFSLLVVHGFSAIAALPLIIIATAILGFGVERIAIAPLTRALSFGWVLTTLGMSVVLRNVAELQWGPDPLRVPAFIDRAPVSLLGSPFRVDFMVTIAGAVALVTLLELADRRTIIGKAMVATAINRELAQLRGINVGLLGIGSFVVAGALGGIAGLLIAPITFASFNSGVLIALKGFLAIAIGGWGRHVGALAGGLLIGVAESLAILWVDVDIRNLVPLPLLAAILLIRPQGLFGRRVERHV